MVHGHRMLLHDFARDKWISPYLAAGRLFEPFETEWLENLVRPGDTVFDIGAHIGFYTLLLARLVGPAGKVLAFEPDPANFALLQQNVVLNRYANVALYNLALSSQAGSAALFLSGDNAGEHRLWQPAEARPSVPVPTSASTTSSPPTSPACTSSRWTSRGPSVPPSPA
jgi:FkbM family methyltransferase